MRHDETVISGLYLQIVQMIVIASMQMIQTAINTIITIDMICVNIIVDIK
jgi:hypothetical protein